MEHYTLMNLLKFSYPSANNIALSLLRNGNETNLITLSGTATKTVFALGCIGILGIGYYLIKKPLSYIYQWYKSIGNANDKLTIIPNPRNKNQKVYAVVYGARNHGSRAFCNFLAQKGYSLIIIDSDEGSLNSAEKHITKSFNDISIMKVKMENFEESEALRIIKQINKFGELIKGLVITKNVMLNEQNSKKFEDLSYDEIHQIMYDNNEMMVGLINVLLKSIKKAGNGFIINLRNQKYKSEEDSLYWDLLYNSTSKYSTILVECLKKSEKSVNFINVSVNYDKIKTDEDKDRMCWKTFSNLGINDCIEF